MANRREVDDRFFDEPDSEPREGFREDDEQLSRRQARQRQNRTTGRIFGRRSEEETDVINASTSDSMADSTSDTVVADPVVADAAETVRFEDNSFDVTEEFHDHAATIAYDDDSSWAPNYVANAEFDAYYDQLGATDADRSAQTQNFGKGRADKSADTYDSAEYAHQERVISQMHGHPLRLFLPALITIAVAGAVTYFFGFFEEDWENWSVLAAGIAVVLLFGLLPLLFWLSTNYTITTRRVVIRRGFLTQIRQELLHSRSYDVTVRRGPIQRMFGTGDVLINAGLEHPIVLHNVQDVVLVQNVLQELMERSASSVAYRRQRGQASRH